MANFAMSHPIPFALAPWASESSLIHHIESHMSVDTIDKLSGWCDELNAAPHIADDYENMWNIFASHIHSMGYVTDFPMLNHRAKLMPAHIPSLSSAWTHVQGHFLAMESMLTMFRESKSHALNALAKEMKYFSLTKMYENRLTTYHLDYIRSNRSVIELMMAVLRKQILIICSAYGFSWGLRPALNLAIGAANHLVNAPPSAFVAPSLNYPTGFDESFTDLDIRESTLWFPRALHEIDGGYIFNHQDYVRTQFQYLRWHHINAYSVAWNHKSGITVAVHPKVIHPNFVFHRMSGLVTQWINSNERSNYSALDMFSIYDSLIATDTDFPDVPDRISHYNAASRLGLLMMLYNQLTTMLIAGKRTGKGSVKPKWSVSPANIANSVLSLNMAIAISEGHL